jgi:hypothetical protein
MAKKSQIQKFKEAAREAEADQSKEAFDAKVKVVARASVPKTKEKPSK